MHNLDKTLVVPEARGGASTSVVLSNSLPITLKEASSFAEKVFASLKDDKNLIYLAARLQNYIETTEHKMECMRQAIEIGDGLLIADIAKELSDSTARLGAIGLMRHFISLQMLGRRGLILQSRKLMAVIDAELVAFKSKLISVVG
jgi:hypothetical protein